MRTILVTGGVDFIGSAVVRGIAQHTADRVMVVDRLTYADNLMSLAPVAQDTRFVFEQVDIYDRGEPDRIFRRHQPGTVMHLAAESHVDRSVDGPVVSIETSILSIYALLETAHSWWNTLATEKKLASRFHHISTDEVYGDLHGSEDFFTETTPHTPSSPYSASRISSDHLMCAWLWTYGPPTLITNCSSNCDPYYFPEKLISLTILDALASKPLPMYGNGQQVRGWLCMEDHTRAPYLAATRGESGETYNIGGHNERENIGMVETIRQLLGELVPHEPQNVVHHHDLITFVADRPGHNLRYVIDASRTVRELGWTPAEIFTSDVRKTVVWYLVSGSWQRQVQDGSYQGEHFRLQG